MPAPPGGGFATGRRTAARIPRVPAGRGAYESFFLKLASPEGGRAVWVRYTTLRYADGRLSGALWFSAFGGGAPVGMRRAVGEGQVAYSPDSYVEVDGAIFGPGTATGALVVAETSASWDLTFDDGLPAFRHLHPDWLYAAPLPRTKVETLHPASTFAGWVNVGGQVVDVTGWRGMVGHNWGAEHAEEWIWLQGNDIGVAGCHLDVAAGRLLVGGRLTPWVANGVLVLDGTPVRLAGFRRLRKTSVSAAAEECVFRLAGLGVEVTGLVRRRPEDSLAWDYEGPSGERHWVVNSSVADVSLTIRRSGTTRHLALAGAAVYEHGSREPAVGEPMGRFE